MIETCFLAWIKQMTEKIQVQHEHIYLNKTKYKFLFYHLITHAFCGLLKWEAESDVFGYIFSNITFYSRSSEEIYDKENCMIIASQIEHISSVLFSQPSTLSVLWITSILRKILRYTWIFLKHQWNQLPTNSG